MNPPSTVLILRLLEWLCGDLKSSYSVTVYEIFCSSIVHQGWENKDSERLICTSSMNDWWERNLNGLREWVWCGQSSLSHFSGEFPWLEGELDTRCIESSQWKYNLSLHLHLCSERLSLVHEICMGSGLSLTLGRLVDMCSDAWLMSWLSSWMDTSMCETKETCSSQHASLVSISGFKLWPKAVF